MLRVPLRVGAISACLLLAIWMGLPGNAAAQPRSPEDVPVALLPNPLQPIEAYVFQLLSPIRAYGVDRRRITADRLAEMEADRILEQRSEVIGHVLGHDLHNDGRVTLEEARAVIRREQAYGRRERSSSQLDEAVRREAQEIMAADADGDAVIEFDELRSHADTQARRLAARTRDLRTLRALLALDPNGDGVLTVSELEAKARDVFRKFDKNGNDLINAGEGDALRQARRGVVQTSSAKPCALPQPENADEIVLLGTYEGQSVSPVSVAGQDRETSTTTLLVEEGDGSLFVVLAAYDGMIWQFKGATGRIARVAVLPRKADEGPGAGVTGLPSERVTFLEPGSCFSYFSDGDSGQARLARAVVEQTLGRPVDHLLGQYSFRAMRIPSGKVEEIEDKRRVPIIIGPGNRRFEIRQDGETLSLEEAGREGPEGVDRRLWSDLHRFYPGGIATIDADEVVAPGPVELYEVLPQQAGLLQLMQEGAIVRLSDGMLHIVKPIPRFPAGLNGGHSVEFLLGEGIPMPAGSPGHSCVHLEETGKPAPEMRRRCRR